MDHMGVRGFFGEKYPSKVERDLTNGPLGKLLKLLDTQVFSGSVKRGSVLFGDFLENMVNSQVSEKNEAINAITMLVTR